jgi:hypothetical protein
MRTPRPPRLAPVWADLLLATTLVAAAAVVPLTADAGPLQQRERAACVDGSSQQDRSTCLREVAAAAAEARQGARADDAGQYRRNQQRRCEPLPTADRQDCIARMTGQGTTTGSPATGGVYRELVTVVPAAMPPIAAASSSR